MCSKFKTCSDCLKSVVAGCSYVIIWEAEPECARNASEVDRNIKKIVRNSTECTDSGGNINPEADSKLGKNYFPQHSK